jgi:pyruvate kinase
MQKYIAVVNPRMDDDEISHLIAKDIAGALFEISHQNYPLAAKLIRQIKELARRQKRPVSIIQDVSAMNNPLDLEFGLRNGVDWIASNREADLKRARGLDKLAGIIFKGRNIPKGIRVDSVMAANFMDPDAQVVGHKSGSIKHLISQHADQALLDSLIHVGGHAGATHIAVGDLDLAKALSWRRPNKKIVFAPQDHSQAARAGILWGVHPIFAGKDLSSSLKNVGLAKKGDRIVDATNIKHVAIHLVS